VTTEPLAGTRSNEVKDEGRSKLRRDLTTHPKEIFEHAISVKEAV